MIGRTIYRRLEELEAFLPPPGEPEFMTVEFVSSDGEVVDTRVLQLGEVRPPGMNRRSAKRSGWRNGVNAETRSAGPKRPVATSIAAAG